ncbi:hypothetical protein J7S78_14155 [Klebsiella oxytoca]|uniref:Uncharacterized protein n=1 Tax=Klebsiella oxytoca TaxID=571 RepID=A0AAP2BIQ1_KLEOX|nr:hypothetical protein [Klebsiella oxytoca]MBQ0600938.1 hypothetical protein [Klebsiella oxytoca]
MVSKVRISFDGKQIDVSGNNIRITGGVMYANGQQINVGEVMQPIHVTINGDIGVLETESGDVTINGNVSSVSTKNGNVSAQNVTGDITTKNGSVACGSVSGSVDTKNGNINRR